MNNKTEIPFEQAFLGELLAEGIISNELFNYALEKFKNEKEKDEEMER